MAGKGMKPRVGYNHAKYAANWDHIKGFGKRKQPKKHVCHESRTCTCSIIADEPDESCPVHGAGEYPPRCCVCGCFVARKA